MSERILTLGASARTLGPVLAGDMLQVGYPGLTWNGCRHSKKLTAFPKPCQAVGTECARADPS